MTKYTLSVLLLFVVTMAVSQQPALQWAKVFTHHNPYNFRDNSNGRSVAVDQQGNVYSAGLFFHTVDFDPGPGVFDMTAAGNGFSSSIYISKLSAAGDFIWAVQIPTLVEFGQVEIKVDLSGNLYLASNLPYPADMDPGAGVYTLKPTGSKDAFVVKLDPNGKLIWAKQFGGTSGTTCEADALDIDNDNNLVICGKFSGTVDFDPGANTSNLVSTAHIQSYITKLNGNGDFIWAKQIGHAPVVYSGANIGDVRCDPKGNIYTVGTFRGVCDFDPGTGNYILQGKSLADGFVLKLDAAGNFVWAKRIGNTNGDYYQYAESRGIELDANNNVYTTGDFTGTFDLDPGANSHVVTSANFDWYVLKLNEQGDFVWADVFGGKEGDVGADVAVDNDGNVYAVGTIGPVADMDPGPGVHTITTTNKYGASALVKFNSDGGFIYGVPFDAIRDGSSLGRRMVVDRAQNIYIAGYVSGIVDFDPGPDVYPLNSIDDEAPIVVKLGKCKNQTTATLNISACSSYILNNETFDSSGIYTRTLVNAAGCDSIVTLHLTINKKFTKQAVAICQGQSFFAGGTKRTVPGTYLDTLKTSTNCDSVVTTILTVDPKPVPDLGPDRDLCAGTQTVITPGTYTSYRWQDMSTAKDFTVGAAGVYWVEVTNSFHCTATDTFVVRSISPLPAHFLKPTDSICSYGKLPLTATGTYNNYLWSTGAGGREITIDKPGKYWLTATDANGCSGTDSITVFQKECRSGVYIPTAFTPNSDGKNDLFKALVFGRVVSFKLQVFDRFGQLLFQTTDPAYGWDGRNKGNGYGTSVFVWQCFYQLDQQKPGYQKGTVTIVR